MAPQPRLTGLVAAVALSLPTAGFLLAHRPTTADAAHPSGFDGCTPGAIAPCAIPRGAC